MCSAVGYVLCIVTAFEVVLTALKFDPEAFVTTGWLTTLLRREKGSSEVQRGARSQSFL